MASISWIGIRHPSYQLQLHHFYLFSAFLFFRGEGWGVTKGPKRLKTQNQEKALFAEKQRKRLSLL